MADLCVRNIMFAMCIFGQTHRSAPTVLDIRCQSLSSIRVAATANVEDVCLNVKKR